MLAAANPVQDDEFDDIELTDEELLKELTTPLDEETRKEWEQALAHYSGAAYISASQCNMACAGGECTL